MNGYHLVTPSLEWIRAIVRAAQQIPGWMTRDELAWLARMASGHERILEVGSYMGRSTTALALATPGRVTCCDDFRGEAGTRYWRHDELYAAFLRNMGPYIARGAVLPFTMDYATFAARWRALRQPPYEMIFIDGDHSYNGVLSDCRHALAMIAPTSLICGHDWMHGEIVPALADVFPLAKPVVGSIWVANHASEGGVIR